MDIAYLLVEQSLQPPSLTSLSSLLPWAGRGLPNSLGHNNFPAANQIGPPCISQK